jgi:LysM repeat protein
VAHLKDNTLGGQPLHTIKIYNDNYYVIARAGDTFKLIGEEIKVSYKKIAKYNERDRNDPIEPGEIIWLKKKKTKAPKSEKGRLYYVKAGDSMYSISQQYGMRLKALYKINKLQPDYQIRVGDALKLR